MIGELAVKAGDIVELDEVTSKELLEKGAIEAIKAEEIAEKQIEIEKVIEKSIEVEKENIMNK
jgi:hypothetical protein